MELKYVNLLYLIMTFGFDSLTADTLFMYCFFVCMID